MGYISSLPNKLHPTGIQLNSIKVSFTGHRGEALPYFDSLLILTDYRRLAEILSRFWGF